MNDTEPDRKFDLHIKPEVPNPARQFVGLLLGFGVSVGIGLAPLLGRVNVPLFSSLLTLMPESLQNRLIVLSTTVMSVMSVAVQFYAGVKVTTERLERLFKRTLIYSVVSLILFIAVNTVVVQRVQLFDGKSVSIVIGFSRRNVPPCKPEMSNEQCIAATTLAESNIIAQWGDNQIKLAELLLQFSYLPVYSCLGALVGLLVIRNRAGKR